VRICIHSAITVTCIYSHSAQ